jgi:nucleoporin NUP82
MYDYQRKYVNALLKQLPPGVGFPETSRSILMHSPTTIQNRPQRQGPFLLQPSPLALEGSDCGNATDISYLMFSNRDDEDEDDEESERLGVLLVAYQDGKVDVFLDVEKVEARWEMMNVSSLSSNMVKHAHTLRFS